MDSFNEIRQLVRHMESKGVPLSIEVTRGAHALRLAVDARALPPPEGVRVTPMGECGVLLDCNVAPDLDNQARLWALAETMRAIDGVSEALCGMGNLLVIFDPETQSWSRMAGKLRKAWKASRALGRTARTLEVPVRYGGASGDDLASVAEFARMPPAEVVRMHTEATYVVFAIGSSPGFGFLKGLPERIAMPRRPVPILRAEKGSVLIGGPQTGVTSAAGPTGWHVIGSTELSLFDAANEPPALLAPGDTVRFRSLGIAP